MTTQTEYSHANASAQKNSAKKINKDASASSERISVSQESGEEEIEGDQLEDPEQEQQIHLTKQQILQTKQQILQTKQIQPLVKASVKFCPNFDNTLEDIVNLSPDLFDLQEDDRPFNIRWMWGPNRILCHSHIRSPDMRAAHFPLGSGHMLQLYRLTTVSQRGLKQKWFGVRIRGSFK